MVSSPSLGVALPEDRSSADPFARGARGALRVQVVSLAEIRRLRGLVVALFGLVLALGAALVLALPRGLAYRPVLEENLSLKGRVHALDGKLAAVERALLPIPDLLAELAELRAFRRALPDTWPSAGDVSSGYGWRRSPISGAWTFHPAVDLDGRHGDPVYAPAPGLVLRAAENEGYGNMVELEHGFGITTSYSHCQELLVGEGQQVERGDLIATIGSTGRATGPHLHFEMRLDGEAVDPSDYLPR